MANARISNDRADHMVGTIKKSLSKNVAEKG